MCNPTRKLLHISSVIALCILGSCGSGALNPTPDPSQGLKAMNRTSLSEVTPVQGQATTNVVLDKSTGLGLTLEERPQESIPREVTDTAAALNPRVRITAPLWGAVVHSPFDVYAEVQRAPQDILRFYLDGRLVQEGEDSFTISQMPGGATHMLQGFLLSSSSEVLDTWTTAIVSEGGAPLHYQLNDPLLTVLDPLEGYHYRTSVPLLVHLAHQDVAPGVLGLELTVDGASQIVYFLKPMSLTLQPGKHTLGVRVVDNSGQPVLEPMFNGTRTFWVD